MCGVCVGGEGGKSLLIVGSRHYLILANNVIFVASERQIRTNRRYVALWRHSYKPVLLNTCSHSAGGTGLADPAAAGPISCHETKSIQYLNDTGYRLYLLLNSPLLLAYLGITAGLYCQRDGCYSTKTTIFS